MDWVSILRHRPFEGLPRLIASLRRVSNTIATFANEGFDGYKVPPRPSTALSKSNDPSSPEPPSPNEPAPVSGAGGSKGKDHEDVLDTNDEVEEEEQPPLTIVRQVIAEEKGLAILRKQGLTICRPMVRPFCFFFFFFFIFSLTRSFRSASAASRITLFAAASQRRPT
jgi:hypothetical protein